MGFVRANILPILKEHKVKPFHGHVLCLGVPDTYFTYDHLLRMALIAKVDLLSFPITYSYNSELAKKNYISGELLFKSIGFSQFSSLDNSKFEGAEYIFDLNNNILPENLKEKFDVIIDHGTLEHVFHFPNALNNIFQMLKIGGRVIHSSPGENYFDHGFYMFSPTIFYDFYSQNKWIINTIQVFQMTPNQETEPPFFADYEPNLFSNLSYGGLDNKMYGTICIAEKQQESSGNIIPQQGLYARMSNWQIEPNKNIINRILSGYVFSHFNNKD
jgi:SAM-dependent methyltransferase